MGPEYGNLKGKHLYVQVMPNVGEMVHAAEITGTAGGNAHKRCFFAGKEFRFAAIDERLQYSRKTAVILGRNNHVLVGFDDVGC